MPTQRSLPFPDPDTGATKPRRGVAPRVHRVSYEARARCEGCGRKATGRAFFVKRRPDGQKVTYNAIFACNDCEPVL